MSESSDCKKPPTQSVAPTGPFATKDFIAVVKNIEQPSTWNLIGNVEGLSTLDLGCGDGTYTRGLIARGAASAFGVDYSDKMVTSAQDQEEKNPVGAKYAQSSVEAYKHEMPVDFVLCHKVLHFAKTHEQLQAMCRSIGDNLKAGGRFAGAACMHTKRDGRRVSYPLGDVELVYPEDLADGDIPDGVLVQSCVKKYNFKIDGWYWYEDTIRDALTNAGFGEVKFSKMSIFDEVAPFVAGQRENAEKMLGDDLCSLRLISAIKL